MTRYVNTASSAGGDGTTNETTGATRAYASLSAWEAARQGDLVTAADGEEVRCCGTAADTTAVVVDGWTTSATYYIHIKGNPNHANGQSFLARWSTSHYRLEASSAFASALRSLEPYTRMTGFQVRQAATNGDDSLRISHGAYTADDAYLEAMIVRGAASSSYGGTAMVQAASRVTYRNCIFYGGVNGGNGVFTAFTGDGLAHSTFENCVAANNAGNGFGNGSGSNTFVLKNCYSGGNAGSDYVSGGGHTLTTCRSEDGTLSTTTATFSTSAGCYFTNVTAGSEDFALGASSALINVGTDLSSSFTTDIAGTTRPTGANTWDIGVWEYVAAGGASASGAISAPAATLSAAVTVSRTASGALTVPATTLAASATVARSASGAVVVPASVLAASSVVDRSAFGGLAIPTPSLAAAASTVRTAAGDLDIPAQTLSATLAIAREVAGALVVAPLSLAASVEAGRTASGALALPAPVLSAAAARVVAVAGALAIPAPTLQAVVSIARFVSGELALAVPVLAADVQTEMATVSGALVVPMPVLSADVLVSRTASGGLILAAPVLDGDAIRVVAAEGVLLLRAVTMDAQAAIARLASGDLDVPALVAAAQAVVGVLQPVLLTRADVISLTDPKDVVPLNPVRDVEAL